MSIREVLPGEENLPTCKVCGAMVKGGKCLSCGTDMEQRAREWRAKFYNITGLWSDDRVAAFAASEFTEATKELREQRDATEEELEEALNLAQSRLRDMLAECKRRVAAESALATEQGRVRELQMQVEQLNFLPSCVRKEEAQAQEQAGIKEESQPLCPKCKHVAHTGKSCTFGGAHGFSDDACGCIADALEKKQ